MNGSGYKIQLQLGQFGAGGATGLRVPAARGVVGFQHRDEIGRGVFVARLGVVIGPGKGFGQAVIGAGEAQSVVDGALEVSGALAAAQQFG